MSLPIHECIPTLLDALNNAPHCVLQAPPGAGKTTQVPLSLLNAPWLKEQKIIMLEPRRVAALNAANRMANMLGEKVGETVGYRMRQATKVGAKTRIEVITEGLLTRWLQDDPELTGVGIVIFDEFHERSLNTDVGLALSLQARELFRESDNPLKILVMSATLDSENVASLLEQSTSQPSHCPVVTSQGRSYPVDIRYQPVQATRKTNTFKNDDFLPPLVRAIEQALVQDSGSILVFLPGVREINRIHQALAPLPNHTICLPLHGSLPLEQQQLAIAPTDNNCRKIVLATDIAETSLTIEGVRVVIDSGLTRNPSFDPNTGLTRLHTQGVSQASAEQRAGRAGRMEPGVCYRLWSEAQHNQRLRHTTPEIINADLMPLAITLLHWGVSHPSELQWLNPPAEANWQQALDALTNIGALAQNNTLTLLGQRLALFPCHPRLAALLIHSEEIGATDLGGIVAALLSERPPKNLGSDIYDHIGAVEQNRQPQHKAWQQRVKQLAKNLCAPLKRNNTSSQDKGELTGLLIANAFPERIAKRKASNNGVVVYQLANGRAAQLDESDALAQQPWLSVAEVGGLAGQSQDRIFIACALNPRFLKDELTHHIKEVTIAQWQDDKGRFIAEQRQLLGKIIIQQKALNNIPKDIKTQALTALLRDKGLDYLDWDDNSLQLVARVQLLRQYSGDDWPDMSQNALLSTLDKWLTPHLANINTLADFKKIPVFSLLKTLLPWPQPQQLDELAPAKIAIPSGRMASIDYQQSPPVLAVKLQEMFGCHTTPTILNGQQKITVHLLSPAKQPLQVTQDLAAFWATGYTEVKKEMKGRYPRHPWPDDPLSMEATAKTKRALAREDKQ